MRSLTTFWFVKGDKLLIPTYRYYLGIGVFLLLGLAAANAISRTTGSLGPNPSLPRNVISAVIVATSPVIIFALAETVLTQTATHEVRPTGTFELINLDPITLYLGGIVAFVLLVSISCWILTAKLDYVGAFLILAALPASLGLLYLLAKVVSTDWSELVAYSIYFSLLSSACGFWITRVTRVSAS
jgi:hypothetical protein